MRSAAILLLPLTLLACKGAQPERVPRHLVVVGDVEIDREDYERTYVARLMSTGENDTRKARLLHLDNLIDAELLRQEARRSGLADDSTARRKLDTIRKKAVGATFFERTFLSRLEPPTDEEIRLAFARWKEKAVVRHLFYRDSSQAAEAYDRLSSGVSFLDEAQRCFKTSTYDSSAGHLGPVGYFEVDDAFAEAAFSLRQNEFSRPVRSRFGYHIILLEDKLLSPLVTETEFQTRRAGISSKWRLRKRRLEGDRFVQSFMQGLDVRVNAPAIRSLADAIALIERTVDAARPTLKDPEAKAIEGIELESSTPLAHYRFAGQDLVFTLDDYASWFDELPFPEARHRTAASVGRALRNEALATAGEAEGLGSDPFTLDEVAFQERIYLSRRMRERLGGGAYATGITAEDSSQVDLESQLAPLAAERKLLEHLRSQTFIRVDSVQFEAMAKLASP